MMIDQVEYERLYYGRIYGKRRARVVVNQDPERRGRVKVENTELYGSTASPWAMPCYPFYGGVDSGFFSVPPIGSLVWIECEEGLPEHPVYTGGFFDLTSRGHITDGSPIEDSDEFQSTHSAAPAHARGDFDGSDYGGLKGGYGVPASSFEGEYGEVTVLQTKTGHRLEFDDTEGGERVQIHHANGAHIEILPDGSVVIATEGKILTRAGHREEIVLNSRNSVIGDEDRVEVEGDSVSNISGTKSTTVDGEMSLTVGSASFTTEGTSVVSLGDLDATTANNLQLSIGGDLGVVSFGDLDFNIASKGFISFSNVGSVPETPILTPSGSVSAINGSLKLVSTDLLNTSTYGLETRGGVNGQVFLGSLGETTRIASLGVSSVPLLKERAVIGEQLSLFLESIMTALDTFFTTMESGGSTPGYGGPNPVLAAASTAAFASLAAARATFLTPSLILSNCVYLSKE